MNEPLTPLAQVVRLKGWGAQRRLARAVGLSDKQMSLVVNGHVMPDDGTRDRIARELGRKVADLWPKQELPDAA